MIPIYTILKLAHMGLPLHATLLFRFSTTLPLFVCCSHPFYLLYNICYIKHSQSSLSNRYLQFVSKLIFSYLLSFFLFLMLSIFHLPHSYLSIMEPVSGEDLTSRGRSKVNHALLVHLAGAIERKEFLSRLQLWQDPCEVVPAINHVLTHRS